MQFKRKPRFRRIVDLPRITLTARDEEILRAVHRHRFLRSHQISELVGGSRQQILRRLQMLFHHGYLERPLCQLDYYQKAGSRSMVYGLANRGTTHLRKISDEYSHRLHSPSHNLSVKRLFLEHALMVSDIMVSLELTCRKRGDVRLLIEDEIPLPASTRKMRAPFRWTVTVSGKEKVRVIPDRIFTLEFADKKEPILCFLEADRGTMPIHRQRLDASCFERKFAAYEATWTQGVHRSHFGVLRVRVLTVTTSEERTEHLCVAGAKLGRGRRIFLFADLISIHASQDLPSFAWRSVTGADETLLD